jgi:hypothetical protein
MGEFGCFVSGFILHFMPGLSIKEPNQFFEFYLDNVCAAFLFVKCKKGLH